MVRIPQEVSFLNPRLPGSLGTTHHWLQSLEDSGCSLFPSCLDCPLALCRYDESPRNQESKFYWAVCYDLLMSDLAPAQIAKLIDKSTEYIYDVVAKAKQRGGTKYREHLDVYVVPYVISKFKQRFPSAYEIWAEIKSVRY